jgi:SnoaL-like polyketide cyclase.
MDYEEWIATYATAWRSKDAVAVTRLFAEDAVYRSSPTGVAHVGRDAIAEYWRRATATQQDLELRFGTPIRESNRVAVEWWAVMRDPEWRPEAAGHWVTLPGCLVLRLDADGLCSALREYYNPAFGEAIAAPPGWVCDAAGEVLKILSSCRKLCPQLARVDVADVEDLAGLIVLPHTDHPTRSSPACVQRVYANLSDQQCQNLIISGL